MSSNNTVIRTANLSKIYEIYSKPGNRLRQFIFPKIQKLIGLQVQKYYEGFGALRNISLEILDGDTIGIIGKNGSGKSTLLQLICGTLYPSEGEVSVQGKVAALLELGSGFNPDFTGRENVYLNGLILGLSSKEIDSRFSAICEFADIGAFIDQPIKTYSSGMLVRLAFAVIAHVDAEILIVDEAFAVGDIFFTQKCMRFLRNFMKKNTIIFVSHDIASIKNICTRVIWLENGNIVLDGNPNLVCDAYLESYHRQLQVENTIEDEADEGALLAMKINSVSKIDEDCNFQIDNNNLSPLENSRSFGKGGAVIRGVQLMNESGKCLSSVQGGESAVICVIIKVLTTLKSPIVGFYIKDRLGQTLFGDNTYLTYKETDNTVDKNQIIKIYFYFNMPVLMAGEYTIAVAIADGTQEQHEQHHWVHDAISFISGSNSLSTGIMGIPMKRIKMEIVN